MHFWSFQVKNSLIIHPHENQALATPLNAYKIYNTVYILKCLPGRSCQDPLRWICKRVFYLTVIWDLCQHWKHRIRFWLGQLNLKHMDIHRLCKGQLISEFLLGVIDFPKNQRKIWQISALESKKWSNQQSKSTSL